MGERGFDKNIVEHRDLASIFLMLPTHQMFVAMDWKDNAMRIYMGK